MRAEITKDGKLAIIPESFTEDYALAAFIENEYNKALSDVNCKVATTDVAIYLDAGLTVFKLNILPIGTSTDASA